MNHRWELIQAVIDKVGAQSYLEIGIGDKKNFDLIKCPMKVGIDIHNNRATFKMSSDDFFKNHREPFDVIFIDGDHEKGQVLRDMKNSLECLSKNGVIIMHDTLPLMVELLGPRLCYDAWEAFDEWRRTRSDVWMASVLLEKDNTGCGVIRHGHQELYTGDPATDWNTYWRDRDKRMNVLSVEKVLEML